jgi:K+-sensing histidine kinase KdpD
MGGENPSHAAIRAFFGAKSSEQGIFMAVIRNIIEAHRGIIRFVEDDASGLSMVLYLPCIQEAAGSGRNGASAR